MNKEKIGAAIVKRDTLENWQKAKNYIPLLGTIIVVDMPDSSIKFQIGDGKTLVVDLLKSLETSNNSKDSLRTTPKVDDHILKF